MFKAWLEACPWDVTEPTDATLLDRLHGEIGVAGLTVPVAVEPMSVLRTRGREVVPFITNGGLAFRPSERGEIAGARFRVANCIGDDDPLAACAQACQESELALRLLVDIDALGSALADSTSVARVDAFGHAVGGRVCLSHESMADQLQGLIEEISRRYEPASIEIVDTSSNFSTDRPNRWGLPVSSVIDALLEICFCDACCAAASGKGADGQAAAKVIHQYLQTEIVEGKRPPSTPDGAIAESSPLHHYLSAIGAARSGLIKSIGGRGAPALALRIADRDRRISARDLPALAQAESAVIVPSISPADRMPDAVEQARCTLHIGAADLRYHDASRLVALMKDAAAAGFTGVEMSHLAACNDSAWDAIRQALRIARRKDM